MRLLGPFVAYNICYFTLYRAEADAHELSISLGTCYTGS